MTWFDLIVIATASMQALNMWWLGKGKVSYALMFSIYAGYLVIETTLAVRDPYQWSIALFCALNVWAMINGVIGFRRERNNRATIEAAKASLPPDDKKEGTA